MYVTARGVVYICSVQCLWLQLMQSRLVVSVFSRNQLFDGALLIRPDQVLCTAVSAWANVN